MVAKLRNAAVSYGKRYRRNYFVRFLDGHGWGCWRTADDTPEEAAAKTAKSLERKNKAAAKAAA
ncbi:MAG: hypothetical protein KAS32_29625, partial [Candidatus Peribacteraceae bacterium]|nr:hypothetical protein [Candidatus Peribacteraceae bacterium]